jgi:hypothetical protein
MKLFLVIVMSKRILIEFSFIICQRSKNCPIWWLTFALAASGKATGSFSPAACRWFRFYAGALPLIPTTRLRAMDLCVKTLRGARRSR